MYDANPQVAARYGLALAPLPDPIYDLSDQASIAIGSLAATQIFAPGHSPASVCFHVATENLLVGGDVLFRDSIGRTDLPGGNHETLLASIKNRVYTLPPTTVVYPGHGPKTTIAYEKANNSFVRA